MKAERARKRREVINRDSPKRIAVAVTFILGLLGLYWWWSHWFVLVLLGLQVLFIVMETITWLDARRRLKHPELDSEPRRSVRRRPTEERQDPDVGKIEWRPEEESWCTDYLLDDEQVVVRLDGTREEGPKDASKAMWNAIKPRVPGLWAEVAAYANSWSVREGAVPLEASDLAVNGLDISPDNPLEDGEVVFHFYAATDPDGSYFVPLHDGKPLLVHRDS